jgi:hypothetical protein
MIVATVNLEMHDAIINDLFLRSLYPSIDRASADMDSTSKSDDMIIDRYSESSSIY